MSAGIRRCWLCQNAKKSTSIIGPPQIWTKCKGQNFFIFQSFSVFSAFWGPFCFIYVFYVTAKGISYFTVVCCLQLGAGSWVWVKITLITIKLLAELVMVLIEQISATTVWTGGGSSPPQLSPSPLTAQSPVFFASSLRHLSLTLLRQMVLMSTHCEP